MSLLIEVASEFLENLVWESATFHLSSPSLVLGSLLDTIVQYHHLPTCIAFSRLNWEGLTSRLQKNLLQDEEQEESAIKKEEEDIPVLQFLALHLAVLIIAPQYCHKSKTLVSNLLEFKLFQQCPTLCKSFGLIFTGTFFQKLLIGKTFI